MTNFHLIFWSAEDKENSESMEQLDTCDASTSAGLAETIAICWGGIKHELDKVHFMITIYKMFGAMRAP